MARNLAILYRVGLQETISFINPGLTLHNMRKRNSIVALKQMGLIETMCLISPNPLLAHVAWIHV